MFTERELTAYVQAYCPDIEAEVTYGNPRGDRPFCRYSYGSSTYLVRQHEFLAVDATASIIGRWILLSLLGPRRASRPPPAQARLRLRSGWGYPRRHARLLPGPRGMPPEELTAAENAWEQGR